jgi:hypothetical protein
MANGNSVRMLVPPSSTNSRCGGIRTRPVVMGMVRSRMQRYLAESLTIVVVSIIIVLGTLALGGIAVRETASARQLPLAMMPGCFDAPLVQVDGSGIDGEAKLCVADEAVRPALRVANLTPDSVYLALFEYFEQPTTCQSYPCGSADLRDDGSGGTLARMDGIVANGTRRADFRGDFRDLPLTRGAQVTLTLFDRASVRSRDTGYRAHQLLSLPAASANSQPHDLARVRTVGQRVAQAIFLPTTEEAP